MLTDLSRIVHHVVLNSQMPAKALAKEVGKSYSTLLREVNPYDTGAKLGVDTLMEIMRQTGNVDPLIYMAKQFGFDLVPDVSCSGQRRGDGAECGQEQSARGV
ncbi:amino acid-binding protein [Desulfovibrio mangrovi]|uniref:phage regulatory CII family protein n=1 Tax=Desulfovibrio mangrovi TaxID=2976983 RepID=UPI0022456343|nr:phage regulatory CII family protein [Desulfovibrio mangrovi]UZP65876.1 amino acid-binding protein [Desulfovibrio mangrovi]